MYVLIIGLSYPAMSGVFSRPLIVESVVEALAAAVGGFCLMVLYLFLRGKTDVRTLTISEQGISTEIGSLKGQVPWNKVSAVAHAGNCVLILRSNGNAFFIPGRAFSGPEQQAQFITEVRAWWKAA
jgi:hypothetical protein